MLRSSLLGGKLFKPRVEPGEVTLGASFEFALNVWEREPLGHERKDRLIHHDLGNFFRGNCKFVQSRPPAGRSTGLGARSGP
jgi:hypothetical protein